MRFVVDTMLGRLARWLRALGYDTLYLGQADDRHLLRIALVEGRLLVTRDRPLALLARPHGWLVRTQVLDDQIVEVVRGLGLVVDDSRWLSRCLECNALIEPCSRDTVAGRVPAHILDTHETFMGCPGCGKLYWAGSHADRMLARLHRLLDETRPNA